MEPIIQGEPPPPNADFEGERHYLRDKPSDARKDAQWLLSLGAAGVLGVVIKDGFGLTTPNIRFLTLAISMVQILISMFGALTWSIGEVDKAQIIEKLSSQLKQRNRLRNWSVFLLAVSFILVAYIGLQPVLCKK